MANPQNTIEMEKTYTLSDIEFEELECSIELENTTYTLSRATSYPDDFFEDSHHCDMCALYERCHDFVPKLNVCGTMADMLDLNLCDISKLFFN